ncbi:MAG: zinc-ribbon domain-containing protein [Deltaproteobacteria bacterium]|nr:zinc-ribbon domain-containing protein [Deltaproteobacteria bacterium]
MKFVCEQCSTQYSIADEKVRQKILRIRCKNCGNVITVREGTLSQAGAPAAVASPVRLPAPAAASAPPAASVPRPALPPPLARPPARPVAVPPRAPEVAEWHLAIDGEQSGPQKLTDLCRKVIAAAAGAETYLWKDGMDGWKVPSDVPAVAARIQELNVPAAPPVPPPRVHAPPAPPALPPSPLRAPRPPGISRATAGSGLLAIENASVTPTPIVQPLFPMPSPVAMASAFDDFGNDGATQISPMDLDKLDNTDKVAVPDLMFPETIAKPTNGHAGSNGRTAPPEPGFAADLFAGNHSMPFFPSPSPALGGKPGPTGGPLTGGPPPAESGLSKLLLVGGIFVRKPYLKAVAAAVAFFVIVGAVALAVVGAGAPAGPLPSEIAKAEAAGAIDPSAAAEKAASRWFPEGESPSLKRAAVGPAPVRPGFRSPGRLIQKPGAAPVPAEVAPPPVAAVAEPTVAEPPPSRKLTAPVERRAVGGAVSKASAGPSADQVQGIRNTVSSRMSRDSVKACYDRGLRASGASTGGRIEVEVSIGMSGKVTGVQLKSPDALKPVHGCVKTAVSRWRFPGGPEAYGTQFTLLMQSGG